MSPRQHSCCSYCGRAFAADQPWPRTCAGCAQVSYLNPLLAFGLEPLAGVRANAGDLRNAFDFSGAGRSSK